MLQICNQAGMAEAYVVKNIIVNKENSNAIGVVLGNCVFNKQGSFIGKTMKHFIYNKQGEIVGKLSLNSLDQDATNSSKIVTQGWSIVELIKDHGSSWIENKEQWSAVSISDVLEACA